jgi:hypothetical protein
MEKMTENFGGNYEEQISKNQGTYQQFRYNYE